MVITKEFTIHFINKYSKLHKNDIIMTKDYIHFVYINTANGGPVVHLSLPSSLAIPLLLDN